MNFISRLHARLFSLEKQVFVSFSVFFYASLAPEEDSYRYKCLYIILVQKVVQVECFVLE